MKTQTLKSVIVPLMLASVFLTATAFTKNNKNWNNAEARVVIENVPQTEDNLEIEPWMFNDSIWRSEIKEKKFTVPAVIKEKSLKIENWMTDNNLWRMNKK